MITVAPAHFPGSSTESGGGVEIRCKEEADDMRLGTLLMINLSYSCLW